MEKVHEGPLVEGIKVVTRRRTSRTSPWFRSHLRALESRGLVRVWCGGYGKLPGYVRYTSIVWQRLCELTPHDVALEGYPGRTVKWLLNSFFYGIPLSTEVAVFSFDFLPLVQQVGAAATKRK